jgi:hypothetical protein
MGPPSDMRSVVGRNFVMRCIPLLIQLFEGKQVISCVNHSERKHTVRVSVSSTPCGTGFKIFTLHEVSPI